MVGAIDFAQHRSGRAVVEIKASSTVGLVHQQPRHIRTHIGVPFIFLTAYSDKDTIRQASSFQPNNYLIKPVNPPGLFAVIQLAIEHHKNQQLQKQPPLPPVETQSALDFFFVKLGNRVHKLHWHEVYAIVSGKNYVTLKTLGTPAAYPMRGSMAAVLNRSFIRSYTNEGVHCGPEFFENSHYTCRQLLAEERKGN